MKKLIEGLRTFVNTVHPSESVLYDRLAHGQSPETLFITCSDSRVCPSLLTDSSPGDLFVIRNAGNIVPPAEVGGGEAATIEYAMDVLGVRDVIVCGHSDCGAMRAVLSPPEKGKLPAIEGWLGYTDRVRSIMADYQDLAPEDRLRRAIEANVLTQLGHLRSHPSVSAAVERGAVQLHGWCWDIGSGGMRAYDAEREEFVDLL